MDNLKKIVIEPAIKQINKYTDIRIEYDQFKIDRAITGLQFRFSQKEANVLDIFAEYMNSLIPKLTEKQILFFANKLA
ncbi:RepB family plasmid replication initiator protein [Acinetobacter nectaris]|uniref:RepB family plasmid replication initiator protein n=1 Tax=Acinetobacter nectaris TaxID=1219382 RepID=UPI0023515E9F|nr:RepB family plasmid replication initiator protein [Acinetobacter nectaris]MCF9047488.1 replication initiation protein [Acinetobacter nectaris]